MLENLRANKGGVITWAFLIAIIAVFVINFGPGSFSQSGGCGASGASHVAKVNGTAISATDFEKQYERRLQLFQAQLGQGFSREVAQQLGVANIALDDVVNRELLAQEGVRRGVIVTDREISDAVRSDPSFQPAGRFDYAAYERAVRAEYGSTGRFESLLRKDLLASKMQTLLAETVKVSEPEVRAAWQAEADRVALSFVRFPVAAAQGEVKVGDAEVKAFAEKNGDRIDRFYDENAARFDQPKKVHARHILVRAGEGGDDAAKAKAQAAADRVKKGEDFAKVAAEVSEDENTKGRGGDLGFVTEALVEKSFADAAFALEAGQVSDPVKTGAGWHVVQAVEVVPAKKVSKEQARPELARELLVRERAQALAMERAEAAAAALKGGKSLADLFPAEGKQAVSLGGERLSVEETGTFGATVPAIPKLGPAPAVLEAALAAKPGQALPRAYETGDGAVVAVVTERETPDAAKFDGQREQVELRLRNRKSAQVFTAVLEQLREDAEVEVNQAYFGPLSGAGQPAQAAN